MKYTKKQQEIIDRYERSNASELRQVYGRYSNAKARSFEKIKTEMRELEGHDMRITGAGQSIYTCAYQYECDGQCYLRYHTKSNVIDIPYGRKE